MQIYEKQSTRLYGEKNQLYCENIWKNMKIWENIRQHMKDIKK